MKTLSESIIGRRGKYGHRGFDDLIYGDCILIKLGSGNSFCCLYLPERIINRLFPETPKFLKDHFGSFVFLTGWQNNEIKFFRASDYIENFPEDNYFSSEILPGRINHIEERVYNRLKNKDDVLTLFDKYILPRIIK